VSETDSAAQRFGWLRLALTTFTIAPVRAPQVDRVTAGRAMTAAPLMGLLVGLAAGVVVAGLRAVFTQPPRLVVATVAVLVLVLASRALHVDGLADTADALGSYRPADAALALMKNGDVGPFGVVAIVLDLPPALAAERNAGRPDRDFGPHVLRRQHDQLRRSLRGQHPAHALSRLARRMSGGSGRNRLPLRRQTAPEQCARGRPFRDRQSARLR